MKDNLNHPSYDLIGDIHGERKALEQLLRKLGYRAERGGAIAHPKGRKLIFLGDFIDRGPHSRGVLRMVRRLVDSGLALAIMGNHEFNFISYHTFDDRGERLRLDTPANRAQIAMTLKSFAKHEDEIPEWIEWMKGLPFFLDFGDLRAVHAAWFAEDIAWLAGKSLRDRDLLIEANRKGAAWEVIGRVLKGPELAFPDARKIPDANGIPRGNMRVRWWGSLSGLSWNEIAFPAIAGLPEDRAELGELERLASYGPEEPPVFFGHYKLKNHPVAPQATNVATLDYGLSHGGPATAYRWDGEQALNAKKFVQIPIYEVFIDDNFHFMDEDERCSAGRFYRYKSALVRAKRIVERSLLDIYKPGMSAEELDGLYRNFGEDPFIVPTPEGRPPFSAWEYAAARAK